LESFGPVPEFSRTLIDLELEIGKQFRVTRLAHIP